MNLDVGMVVARWAASIVVRWTGKLVRRVVVEGVGNRSDQTMDATPAGDATISEEALAVLRRRIGIEYPAKPWNEYASRDAIRHFAEGIGDDNPLWSDPEYAGKTRWGSIIAPPTFLYTCCSAGGGAGQGLPGIFGLWAWDAWDWFQPICVGEKIRASTYLATVGERRGRYAGRIIEQVQETLFFNERNERLGRRQQCIMRMEKGQARGKGKYTSVDGYCYKEAEIQAIEEAYLSERRRGDAPRFWEDVEVGDEVGSLVKGPLTLTSMIAFLMGYGSPMCRTDRIAHLYMHAHPNARLVDPATNIPDLPEASHWRDDLARRGGLPRGYDIGGQRISWMAHLMTDWMGDEGFLGRLEVQLRRPNFIGDTTWCRGRVADKRTKDGACFVECEVWG
ncbi:MAG: MaoC family dehydratase N-terminal domain-containing protein, partial [Chloroflexota bacterium]